MKVCGKRNTWSKSKAIMTMINKRLEDIVLRFRQAIVEAKRDFEFDRDDRMSLFPRGCCDDASELLAHYLYTLGYNDLVEVNAVYDDGIFENITNHVWLENHRGVIIDITADQFMEDTEVYIGEYNAFYRSLRDRRVDNCYAIENSERLWNDYRIIMGYLH